MAQEIGSVLSITFREFCRESNKKAKKDFSTIKDEEIQAVEKILKKVDGKNFDLEKLYQFEDVKFRQRIQLSDVVLGINEKRALPNW